LSARARAARGFTLVELLVVVVIIGVVAVIGLAVMRKSRADTLLFSDQIARSLSHARVQAVASRAWQRVTFTATTITTEYSYAQGASGSWVAANCASDAGTSCTAANSSSILTAPSGALIWGASTTAGAPTSPGTVSFNIVFRPNYTVLVNGTSSVNAFIYVGGPVGVQSTRYLVTVVGNGVVNSSPM
jgi:MSHA pilin protein MshC